MAEQQQRNAGDKPHWQKPRSDSFKGKHGGGGEQGARRPAAPYNPNLARFKRQNPGNGPHGFGGTFKKGEKGGHRPLREGEDIPLAERGLQRHGGAAAAAAPKAKASATAVAGMSATAIKSKIRDLTRLLKKPDLDPIIKQHKERDLKRMEAALEAKKKEATAEKIDQRYKHIKFYEKRKIVRKLAALQRKLATMFSASGGDNMSAEEKATRKEIAKWQLDKDYVDYYPSGEKYIALYAGSKDKSGHESDDEAEEKKQGEVAAAASPSDKTAAAVDAAREAMRKRIAQLKGAALRQSRAEAPQQAPKRKREDSVQDSLFQADDSSDNNDDDDSEAEEEAQKLTQKHAKKQAPAQKDDEEDELMKADEEEQKPSKSKPAKEESSDKKSKAKTDSQPPAKKQKQKQ